MTKMGPTPLPEGTTPDDWEYSSSWNEDDGLIEWYEHKESGQCIDTDEFFQLFGFHKEH